MKKLRRILFNLKYKLIFSISIKFKIWHLVEKNQKGIGKTRVIHNLAKKYDLPVLTNWKELYKDCEVITPMDELPIITKYKDKVILTDAMLYQTSLETMYILGRNNTLVGFTSQVDFNRRDD